MVKRGHIQVLLSGVLLLLVAFSPAFAQAFTINSISSNTPSFGNVGAALSGVTVFRITPAGVVSVVSGNGGDTPSGTQAAATVNIRCTGGGPACNNNNAYVKIAKVNTTAGRANTVSNFTVASGTATVGTVTTNGDGSIQFMVSNLANNSNRTIYVGMDLPIKGDDQSTSTTATAQWTIAVGKTAWPSVPGTNGTATATVRRSISGTSTALSFGPVRKPDSGSGTLTVPANGGARTAAGGAVLAQGGSYSRGSVTVTGQGSQSFTMTLSSPFTLSNGSTSLSATAVASSAGPYTLSAGGSATIYVGGALTVPSSATTGDYSGTVTATIAYN